MPTVNEVLGGVLQNALAHPKTTVQSVLTTLMVGTVALMSCNCLPQKYLAIVGSVMGACKIGLGMLQRDGSTLSVPAGTTVTSDTHIDVTTPPPARTINP